MKRDKHCCICDKHVEYHLTLTLLNKYDVNFYRCSQCGFIQSEDPYWLEETNARPASLIRRIDAGRKGRAAKNAKFMDGFLKNNKVSPEKYLDFGSGEEALFANEMRELGYKYYAMDGLYPPDNDIKGTWRMKYGAITAFETFKHLVDPRETFGRLAKKTNTIIIGTQRASFSQPPGPEWDYFNRRWGAHVSLYTLKSFKILGEEFGFKSVRADDTYGYPRTVFIR
jgi:hypothetical protein